MKKFMSFLILSALCFVFAACSTNAPTAPDTQLAPLVPSEAEPPDDGAEIDK